MDLAGRLLCTPGAALGQALQSTRRPWAAQMTRGRAADELPGLLSAMFALCGGAHRVAAELAVSAARGEPVEVQSAQREALRQDTVREHLRRWWLEGTSLATEHDVPDPRELASCPVMQAKVGIEESASQRWLLRHVFGQDAAAWLQAWQAEPEATARTWSGTGATWPARALTVLRHRLGGWSVPLRALPAQGVPQAASELATALLQNVDGALRPVWQGRPAETGAWTRRAELSLSARRADMLSPVWMRAAARLADVARLMAPDGGLALDIGSASPAPGLGVAWCEMARGLLIHLVRLDAQDRVSGCQVLAPTEWNFHPQGSVARLISVSDPLTPAPRLHALALAFDPCVAFDIQPATSGSSEVSHA